ncbi:SURP and G-patch domain-containing protein 1 [Coemansia sp. S2]|nr:SURP and G-patch domain-containing protein 1 [Coemansia sp. S2]
MAEAYNRNPELVAKVMDAQRDNPRYGFLHENSPLHAYYRWRISQLQGTGIMTGPSQRPPMPPPPRPPLSYLGSSPPMRSPDPSPVPPSAELEGTASCAPGRTRRYFELPAGLMVKAADGFHTPYSALRTADLEAPKFLDSIVACLSDSRDRIPAPELTSELSDALEHFERGSSSDSDSDSDGSSDSSSVVVRPTSVNKALGSDNVGFKMLEKLGWQQGQGLGAAGNGIVEPIRLATRFSSVRGARGRGRGRGRGVERASLGTGRRPAAQPLPDDGADGFESYRQQMSSVYKNSSQWHMQHHDKAADKP